MTSFPLTIHRLIHSIALSLLLFAALPATALGQYAPGDKGKISGRVIGLDSKPVAEAQVTLQETSYSQWMTAVTDEKGRFSFTQLPAGLYLVSASKGGYVARISNQRDATEGAPLRIEADVELSGIDLHLEKGGVITGKITEENGDPVILANVDITDPDGKPNRSREFKRVSFFTDDRGVYRIFGLAPGRYLVRVDLSKITDRQQEHTPFYHPGVGSARQALPVEVTLGAETKDIDFTVKRRREKGGTITGLVTRSDGSPLRQVSIYAYTEDSSSTRVTSVVREDGSYEFKDLPSGDYTIEVLSQDPKLVERTRAKAFVTASNPIVLNINVESGAMIYGRFEMEDGNPPKQPTGFSISATAENPGYQVPGRVAPDGHFMIQRLSSGSVQLSASTGASPYYILKVLRNQEELSEGRLWLDAGDQLQGFHIVLSDQGATLRGTVRQAAGETPAGGAWVRIVPVDEDKRLVLGLTRSAIVDYRGQFVIEGIAPGRYFVLTFRDLRSLPANPSLLDAWIVEHRSGVPVVDLKPKSQQELRLRATG